MIDRPRLGDKQTTKTTYTQHLLPCFGRHFKFDWTLSPWTVYIKIGPKMKLKLWATSRQHSRLAISQLRANAEKVQTQHTHTHSFKSIYSEISQSDPGIGFEEAELAQSCNELPNDEPDTD